MAYGNGGRGNGSGRRPWIARTSFLALVVWVAMQVLPVLAPSAHAASAAPPHATVDFGKLSPEEKLQALKQLLNDPAVTAWASGRTKPAAKAVAPTTTMSVFTSWLDRIRGHVNSLLGAAGDFPRQIAHLPDALAAETVAFGLWRIVLRVVLAVGLGGIGAWFAARLLGEAGSTGSSSLRAFAAALLPIVGFAIGTALAFILFTWPPVWQKIVFGYLLAYLGMRLAHALGKLVLAARQAASLRNAGGAALATAEDEVGAFWCRRTVLFIGYFLFGWVTVDVLATLGFIGGLRHLAAYLLGLGLLAIAITTVWQQPAMRDPAQRKPIRAILLSAYFVILWMLWVGGLNGLLWLGIYAAILRPTLGLAGSLGHFVAERPRAVTLRVRLLPVLAERLARALVIVVAVLWLARVIGFQTESMTQSETVLGRVTRGAFAGIVVLLVADFLWQVIKLFIDGMLEDANKAEGTSDAEKAHRAKLKTLLPIFRHILAATIWIMAVLMVLSGLGVQIGPLIAGAGVIGVAVGFGAQTIVKDVISGMFYLWDDAFRVGEYIQSGNYKGVVEGFSLRSVRLRHHRGPIYTVPFGELGAVENMSRDWVIDKMTLSVTYDTDIAKVKKIIKTIGATLQDDPEFAPNILETLKMKGVDQFGDYAIQLRLAMMTKPGEQFLIRRRAYAMIKEAFEENDVHFAFPTVQVAGDDKGGETAIAAARNVIAMQAEKQAGQ